MRVLSVVIAIIDNDFLLVLIVELGLEFSLITLIFVSCGACYFVILIVFSHLAYC